jgi:hypothetical protein
MVLLVSEIKLVEDYQVTILRNDVRDSLQMAGEQSILLQLYHAGDTDAVPCVVCGDDLYESPEVECPSCFGTMFEGGVRLAMLVWALYTDRPEAEKLSKTGQYRPDAREIQMEAFPLVGEHDVVVRVSSWASAGVPAVVAGYYELQTVQQRSLRTGNRFGQSSLDVVAQKAQLTKVAPDAGITNYPVLGRTFLESMQLTPASGSIPSTAIVSPEVRVIMLPAEVAQGAARTFKAAIGDGTATVFTLTHGLGNKWVTTTIANTATGEVVDADVTDFDANHVTITFADAPGSGAYTVTVIG